MVVRHVTVFVAAFIRIHGPLVALKEACPLNKVLVSARLSIVSNPSRGIELWRHCVVGALQRTYGMGLMASLATNLQLAYLARVLTLSIAMGPGCNVCGITEGIHSYCSLPEARTGILHSQHWPGLRSLRACLLSALGPS